MSSAARDEAAESSSEDIESTYKTVFWEEECRQMNCMNCGAHLTDRMLEYCPRCGANVHIQRKVDYLSKYYYNLGLEKAQIRDLSGAISCLRQSLTYNKKNIPARNLLGLVYFETGEVVSALSEWVISKNLQPNKNLANDYIAKLQANQSRLDLINDTIRKYNEALDLARGRHEDMAAMKLKKILSLNSKLIKGYHLLALIQMHNLEWSKARKTLRRASKIDKTNTTTLRFLREIDEQIGSAGRNLRSSKKGLLFWQKDTENEDIFADTPLPASSGYAEPSRASVFAALMLGIGTGLLAFYLLAVPAIRQRIYREANRQIIRYSDSVSSQGAELSKAIGSLRDADSTAQTLGTQLVTETKNSRSYKNLFEAYLAYVQNDYDSAALMVQQVYEESLSDNLRAIYNMICSQTGVSGIAEGEDDGSYETWLSENASGNTDGGYEYDVGDVSSYDEEYDDYDEDYDDEEYDEEEYDDETDDEEYYDEDYEEIDEEMEEEGDEEMYEEYE